MVDQQFPKHADFTAVTPATAPCSSQRSREKHVRALPFNNLMEHSQTSQIDRLIALANEAEQILARSIGSHDIRHACAVARGYLDLARSYNEPVNVEDVERVISRMRALLVSKEPEAAIEPRRRTVRGTG